MATLEDSSTYDAAPSTHDFTITPLNDTNVYSDGRTGSLLHLQCVGNTADINDMGMTAALLDANGENCGTVELGNGSATDNAGKIDATVIPVSEQGVLTLQLTNTYGGVGTLQVTATVFKLVNITTIPPQLNSTTNPAYAAGGATKADGTPDPNKKGLTLVANMTDLYNDTKVQGVTLTWDAADANTKTHYIPTPDSKATTTDLATYQYDVPKAISQGQFTQDKDGGIKVKLSIGPDATNMDAALKIEQLVPFRPLLAPKLDIGTDPDGCTLIDDNIYDASKGSGFPFVFRSPEMVTLNDDDRYELYADVLDATTGAPLSTVLLVDGFIKDVMVGDYYQVIVDKNCAIFTFASARLNVYYLVKQALTDSMVYSLAREIRIDLAHPSAGLMNGFLARPTMDPQAYLEYNYDEGDVAKVICHFNPDTVNANDYIQPILTLTGKTTVNPNYRYTIPLAQYLVKADDVAAGQVVYDKRTGNLKGFTAPDLYNIPTSTGSLVMWHWPTPKGTGVPPAPVGVGVHTRAMPTTVSTAAQSKKTKTP